MNEISVPGGKTCYRVEFPYIAEVGNQHVGQQQSALKRLASYGLQKEPLAPLVGATERPGQHSPPIDNSMF